MDNMNDRTYLPTWIPFSHAFDHIFRVGSNNPHWVTQIHTAWIETGILLLFVVVLVDWRGVSCTQVHQASHRCDNLCSLACMRFETVHFVCYWYSLLSFIIITDSAANASSCHRLTIVATGSIRENDSIMVTDMFWRCFSTLQHVDTLVVAPATPQHEVTALVTGMKLFVEFKFFFNCWTELKFTVDGVLLHGCDDSCRGSDRIADSNVIASRPLIKSWRLNNWCRGWLLESIQDEKTRLWGFGETAGVLKLPPG